MNRRSLLSLWLLRVVWLLQPLAIVPFVADASASLGSFGRGFLAMLLWAAWATTLLATFVASTVSLTVGRLLSPVTVYVVAVGAAGGSVAGWKTAVAATAAILAVLVWFSGDTGGVLAQGSAYGDEQRFPLKPPVPYLAPMVVSWLVLASAGVFGALLVANERVVIGVVLLALAAVGSWYVGPRFHQLSRRWLVVMPVGVVVHDPMVLFENALFRTADLAAIHLAPAGTEAADITGGTAGVVVEIVLREMDTIVKVAGPDKPGGTALHVRSVLVSPSRPGRALAAAAARHLPVG